jgi:branched-chain amino acid transport system permease protein
VFDFLVHVTIMACLYSLLALSLNLQVGFGGLMNFGQIALFGCGTYGAALAFKYDLGFGAGIVIAGAAAAAVAWIFASIGRNLHADYWGIVTLALAEVIRIIITNEGWLTDGAQGISGIAPLYSGLSGHPQQYLILATCVLVLLVSYALCRHITDGKYGLGLKIMREEPQLAQSLGYDIMTLKRQCMIVSGLIASSAGILFARYVSFVGPDQLTSSETFLVWAMIVIGGLGNHIGVIVGAFLLQFIFAFVPFVKDLAGLPTEFVAAVRLAITGGGLIVFMLWRKAGLIPEKIGGTRLG